MKFLIASLLILSLTRFATATTKAEVQQKAGEAADAAVSYTQEQKIQIPRRYGSKTCGIKKETNELKQAASEKTGKAKEEMKEANQGFGKAPGRV